MELNLKVNVDIDENEELEFIKNKDKAFYEYRKLTKEYKKLAASKEYQDNLKARVKMGIDKVMVAATMEELLIKRLGFHAFQPNQGQTYFYKMPKLTVGNADVDIFKWDRVKCIITTASISIDKIRLIKGLIKGEMPKGLGLIKVPSDDKNLMDALKNYGWLDWTNASKVVDDYLYQDVSLKGMGTVIDGQIIMPFAVLQTIYYREYNKELNAAGCLYLFKTISK